MNISELDNTFVGSELGDIGRLRQIASKFCPEEISQEVRQVIPDSVDTLDLSDIEAGFRQLLAGGSGFPNSGFPQFSFPDVDGSNFADDNPGTIGQPIKNDGFGIGIPETESVSRINYEDTDTIARQGGHCSACRSSLRPTCPACLRLRNECSSVLCFL